MDLERYRNLHRLDTLQEDTRFLVLAGESEVSERGKWSGKGWRVVAESSELNLALASCPDNGLIVSQAEALSDPVLLPLFIEWRRSGTSELSDLS